MREQQESLDYLLGFGFIYLFFSFNFLTYSSRARSLSYSYFNFLLRPSKAAAPSLSFIFFNLSISFYCSFIVFLYYKMITSILRSYSQVTLLSLIGSSSFRWICVFAWKAKPQGSSLHLLGQILHLLID